MRSWTLCALPIQQQHQDTRRGFMEMCQDQCASPQSAYHFIRLQPACPCFSGNSTIWNETVKYNELCHSTIDCCGCVGAQNNKASACKQPFKFKPSVLISCTFKWSAFGMYTCCACTFKSLFFLSIKSNKRNSSFIIPMRDWQGTKPMTKFHVICYCYRLANEFHSGAGQHGRDSLYRTS